MTLTIATRHSESGIRCLAPTCRLVRRVPRARPDRDRDGPTSRFRWFMAAAGRARTPAGPGPKSAARPHTVTAPVDSDVDPHDAAASDSTFSNSAAAAAS